MKMKRMVAALLAMGMLPITVGCNKEETSGKEKIHILCTFDNAEIGNSKETEVNFDEFLKEHPNYEIEISNMSSSDPKMLAMIASGNTPDIIRLSAPSDLPTFVTKDLLIPLDDYVKNSDLIKEDDLYDAVNMFRFDGTTVGQGSLYGLPKDWGINSEMWINKKMFREAGIRIPTAEEPFDLQEFADAARKLTKFNENGEIVQMGASAYSEDKMVEYFLNQSGDSIWADDFASTTLKDAKTKEYFQYIYDLEKEGALESKMNDIDAYLWFCEGKLGMWMTGLWAVTYFTASDNEDIVLGADDLALVPGPVVDKNNPKADLMTVTGGAISKDCKNPDAAWEVLEYIIAGKPAKERAAMGLNMPPLKSQLELIDRSNPIIDQAFAMTESESGRLTNFTRVSPFASAASVTSSINKSFVPALYGEVTLEDAINTIDEDIKFLTEEGQENAN